MVELRLCTASGLPLAVPGITKGGVRDELRPFFMRRMRSQGPDNRYDRSIPTSNQDDSFSRSMRQQAVKDPTEC